MELRYDEVLVVSRIAESSAVNVLMRLGGHLIVPFRRAGSRSWQCIFIPPYRGLVPRSRISAGEIRAQLVVDRGRWSPGGGKRIGMGSSAGPRP